jgi:chromosomal replication initiator protein
VVYPRQVAMYLMREELKKSFPFIGEKLGGRDHTTVMYACDKLNKEIESNELLQQELSLIRERIYNK